MALGSNIRRYPINFGDEHTREIWERKVAEQQTRMMEQGVRYAVAPRCSVCLPDGTWLQEGATVKVQDFAGCTLPSMTLLNRELAKGVVLEASLPVEPEGPTAA